MAGNDASGITQASASTTKRVSKPRGSGRRRPGLAARLLAWPLRLSPFRWRSRNRRVRSSKAHGTTGTRRKGGPSLIRRGLSLLLRLGATLAICGLIGAAGYGAHYFVYHSPRFALKQMKITRSGHGRQRQQVSAESLERRAAVPIGTNLLSIDTRTIETRLLGEPWLKTVSVRRELPATLRVDVTEHEPAALIALESLYLCDGDGEVFKRASSAETSGLPVITGVGRAAYVLEPAYARAQIAVALAALARYQQLPTRPPVGEVHIDRFVGATLYTRQGLAIQLGRGEPAELDSRLARFDAVFRQLRDSESRPVMVFLDNRAHPDHVTVRFAAPN